MWIITYEFNANQYQTADLDNLFQKCYLKLYHKGGRGGGGGGGGGEVNQHLESGNRGQTNLESGN